MADSILRLKVESQEYDNKLKRASEGIKQYAEGCRKAGGTLEVVEKDTLSFVQALGRMETVSKNTKGKVNEMSNSFVELKVQYNQLTNAEKQSPFGKALAKSLDELKDRINQTKSELRDINSEIGNMGGDMQGGLKSLIAGGGGGLSDLNGILGQVGSQMGINTSIVSGLTAGTLGLGAAVAALVAAEYKGVEAFKAYNDEMARQSQITTMTTGLTGTDGDSMTSAARSIAKVYGTDFREVINAANTLMTQFGKSGDESIQLIRDGMQGMILGDGPKLLSMIQQFAPSFRDAGVSASQLVAIIQNSEGGIFTDENMNAIVMGIKNLRLMSNATATALKQIGINGEEMTRQLNDGTITIFDAMQKVSNALQHVEAGSQDAGQVMQQVFGRQGTAAGTNLAKAIATLNTNLDETKVKTGDVGESFAKLELATEELEKSLQKAFGIEKWDELVNYLKTSVVQSITLVTDCIGSLYDGIKKVGDAFGGEVTEYALRAAIALANPLLMVREILAGLGVINKEDPNANQKSTDARAQNLASGMIGNINRSADKTGTYSRYINMLEKSLESARKRNDKEDEAIITKTIELVDTAMDNTFSNLGATGIKRTKGDKVTKTPKPTKTKEEDIFKDLFPDIAQAESEGLSYGEQLMQSILVGMSNRVDEVNKNLLKNLMEVVVKNGIEGIDIPVNTLMDQIIEDGADIPDEYWQNLRNQINEKLKELGIDPIEIDMKTGSVSAKKNEKEDKEEKKYLTDGLSRLAGGLSGIENGFKQLGIDFGEGFERVIGGIQGIASILTGIATIVQAIHVISEVSALIPGFAHGGMVHAANGFAGVVPGLAFSGDNIPIMANAGEVVLNEAQAGVLASRLTDVGGARNIHISGHLEGEQIVLSVDRYGRRSGKGELVFWKNE